MSFFDLILAIIIGGFGLFGLWFGLIHTLGSLVGTVLGVFLASRFYEPLANWLTGITGWAGNFPKVIMFILAFIIINRLVGLLFWVVDRLLSVVTRLPFLNGLNKILGLVFGLLEGVLVLGIIFNFMQIYPLSPRFMGYLANSALAPLTMGVAAVLWPLVPQALQMLRDNFNKVLP
ncbi:MAG: CvpA family protein [Candidatus Magasanikbacteria bacterium]|nr:CvpA family protein [Candidatus Magasanikbacteria bacterium]